MSIHLDDTSSDMDLCESSNQWNREYCARPGNVCNYFEVVTHPYEYQTTAGSRVVTTSGNVTCKSVSFACLTDYQSDNSFIYQRL